MFGVQSQDSIFEPVLSQEVSDEVHENLLSSSDETSLESSTNVLNADDNPVFRYKSLNIIRSAKSLQNVVLTLSSTLDYNMF